MRRKALLALLISAAICNGASSSHAETPEEWVALLTRVHGGFGAFLPVGIRIGEDAMRRLGAGPRELTVTFYQGEGTPCPCPADGIGLAVHASLGQGTLHLAPEKSPRGTFAVALIRPRKGGVGLRYSVPMAAMAKLVEINRDIGDPLGRYHAVMAMDDLFVVEPAG
jgi:formylmethanofuran dehydrogenase subunit E